MRPRLVRAWIAAALILAAPTAALAQAAPAGQGSSPSAAAAQAAPAGQGSSPSAAPANSPATEAVYSGAAVVATGANIFGREVLCGVGEIAGFFTLAVLRLPVWVATLGDRYGSSEPLDRAGNAIIEKACEGPWIVTAEQVKALSSGTPRP